MLEELNVGFVAFSPMANGLLTGAYGKDSKFDSKLDYRSAMPLTADRHRNMMAVEIKNGKGGSTMDQYLRKMLEVFYGEFQDPRPWTPEHAAEAEKKMAAYNKNRENVPAYQDGQEDF